MPAHRRELSLFLSEEALPQRVVDELTAKALEKIAGDYEYPQNPLDKLPSHGFDHSAADVPRRALKLVDAALLADPYCLSPRDIQDMLIAIAYHDSVYNTRLYETLHTGQFRAQRVLAPFGINEFASAKLAVASMREHDGLFTEKDEQTVAEAIHTTAYEHNESLKTVVQPRLNGVTTLPARIVAMADIGAAGIDGTAMFLEEGRRLFRERQPDIIHAVLQGDTFDLAYQADIRDRAITWSQDQIGFAHGRALRTPTELEPLPPVLREALLGVFSRFDDSIQAAQDMFQQRRGMSFDMLMAEMGFEPALPR